MSRSVPSQIRDPAQQGCHALEHQAFLIIDMLVLFSWTFDFGAFYELLYLEGSFENLPSKTDHMIKTLKFLSHERHLGVCAEENPFLKVSHFPADYHCLLSGALVHSVSHPL